MKYDELEVVRRWWALPLDTWLPLSQGGYCLLVFQGRPGGPAGPDVRDAIVRFAPTCNMGDAGPAQVGAVEFHARASDWYVHQHHYDRHYNTVLLHVVFMCDLQRVTRRQDGQIVPVCSLLDLTLTTTATAALTSWRDSSSKDGHWPCQQILRGLSTQECSELLLRAGLLRFEEKAQTYIECLHTTVAVFPFDLYDTCLIPLLIEGLGYGRERSLFRSLGILFVREHGNAAVLDAQLRKVEPLDALRLRAFTTLYLRWSRDGFWRTLSALLVISSLTYEDLRAALCATGLSSPRVDILVCNIILPFAAAVALLTGDEVLAMQAEALYKRYPGLPSNHITRAMSNLLQFEREPRGACRQQGLHYVYSQTCREKRCSVCLLGRKSV